MKHYILTLLLGLCLSLPLMAQSKKAPSDAGAKWLREAYRQHLYEERDLREHMSPGLRLKIGRMVQMLNCDPITNTQDPSPDLLARLKVQPLPKSGYYSVRLSSREAEAITIRLEGEEIKSLYPWPVKPEDLERKFPEADVDMGSAQSFLTTFLHQYLNTYIRASEHIEQELDSLRQIHLSPNALREWERMRDEADEAGHPGFDLLIENYDFDATLVRGELEIRLFKPEEQFYIFSYVNTDALEHDIYIQVGKTDKGYRIEDLGLAKRID